MVIPSKNEASLTLQELVMENRLQRLLKRMKTLWNNVSKTDFKLFQSFSFFSYPPRLTLAYFLSALCM